MLERLVKMFLSLSIYGFDRVRNGCTRQANSSLGPKGIVLYYHAVRKDQRNAFARQMDMLLRMAYPWNLEVCQNRNKKPLVAVTFDDGYVSVIENALPELKQRGIPVTFFVPTGSLGERPGWIKLPERSLWDERVISPNELKNIASEPLVTIGSHTVSHSNLLKLSAKEAIRELVESKAELENLLGLPIEWLSFPHGAYDDSLIQIALEAGYRRLFTIEPKPVNPMQPGVVNGRVATNPDDWLLEFKLKMLGAYRWLPWVNSFKRKILAAWNRS